VTDADSPRPGQPTINSIASLVSNGRRGDYRKNRRPRGLHCRPLALHCRDALLRILAYELRGRRDVGDGELHRIARTIIKDNRLFDPPDLDGRMPRVSKWDR
jgi:hypothetical protein